MSHLLLLQRYCRSCPTGGTNLSWPCRFFCRVTSTYLNALDYQELFSWTFTIVWSQHGRATHNDPTLFHHMCRFSRPWSFWPQKHFSGSWETGQAYHSRPSAVLLWVVDARNQLATQYIKFPHTAEEQVAIKKGFNSLAGLPNTIGAIDRTHIRIKAPLPDAFPYLNRSHYHSINVQLIGDSQNHLMDVVSCFPGGEHDCFIL